MASSPGSSRIPELDGLRGFAISFVILFHYFYAGSPSFTDPNSILKHVYVWFQRCIAIGWSGVDLFFVLSGFLIGGILVDSKGSPSYYKAFYMRRFYRILPLYYLWICGYLVLMWTVGRLMMAYFPDPVEGPPDANVLWLFAFVQNLTFVSYTSLAWFWFSHTWSLAVEEQFYLVAPLLVRRLSRRALSIVMCALVLAAPFARMWVHFHAPVGPVSLELAYTLMPCRADALAIGVLTALLWRTQSFRMWVSSHGWLLYTLTGLFLAGVVGLGRWSPNSVSLVMESVGYTWLAGFYGLLLVLALERPSGPVASLARTKWLRELGRISYCLYLIHPGLRWMSGELMKVFISSPGPWVYVATYGFAAIVAYGLARISWTIFEYPLLRRGHAYEY